MAKISLFSFHPTQKPPVFHVYPCCSKLLFLYLFHYDCLGFPYYWGSLLSKPTYPAIYRPKNTVSPDWPLLLELLLLFIVFFSDYQGFPMTSDRINRLRLGFCLSKYLFVKSKKKWYKIFPFSVYFHFYGHMKLINLTKYFQYIENEKENYKFELRKPFCIAILFNIWYISLITKRWEIGDVIGVCNVACMYKIYYFIWWSHITEKMFENNVSQNKADYMTTFNSIKLG